LPKSILYITGKLICTLFGVWNRISN
jgi:hypothetical protein